MWKQKMTNKESGGDNRPARSLSTH